MADNMNMELNDETMAEAAGGTFKVFTEPKFKVGDYAITVKGGYKVQILKVHDKYSPVSGWRYTIKYLRNGCETDNAFDSTLAYW